MLRCGSRHSRLPVHPNNLLFLQNVVRDLTWLHMVWQSFSFNGARRRLQGSKFTVVMEKIEQELISLTPSAAEQSRTTCVTSHVSHVCRYLYQSLTDDETLHSLLLPVNMRIVLSDSCGAPLRHCSDFEQCYLFAGEIDQTNSCFTTS